MVRFINRMAVFATISMAAGLAHASSVKDIVNATYKLHVNGQPICSGQFVKSDDKDDFFLTAAHCVDNAVETDKFSISKQVIDDQFETISEHVYYLKPVRVMGKKDLALLRVIDPSGDFDTVEVASAEEAKGLEIGTPVIVVGYPKVLEITYTSGEFTGKVKSPMPGTIDSPLYRTTVPVTGGNSGGGLYMKVGNSGYKLIGATTGGFRDVSFMNYFSTAEAVNDLIRTFVGQRATPTPGAYSPSDER